MHYVDVSNTKFKVSMSALTPEIIDQPFYFKSRKMAEMFAGFMRTHVSYAEGALHFGKRVFETDPVLGIKLVLPVEDVYKLFAEYAKNLATFEIERKLDKYDLVPTSATFFEFSEMDEKGPFQFLVGSKTGYFCINAKNNPVIGFGLSLSEARSSL
ncbi:hypothetical protein [Vibrio barjaei]|uniref:hypothetical protein n=1 Tax=Vibrio barjaei TaxID=1676683 RepID=UPI0022839789|nr:hypothetical protein [Vibrio barjaei]MCY9872287.1 hypothetical protein [Vibrio barjaei]